MSSLQARTSPARWLGKALLAIALVAAPAAAQTVVTDLPDYHPGDTAHIFGSGFHPDEVVTLQVVHVDEETCTCNGAGHQPWMVMSDGNGEFTADWYVDPVDSEGATFLLTADCDHGLHAEHYFTDALGMARVTSVIPFDGGCVAQNLPGIGIENWDVVQRKTYIVTLSNVFDCENGVFPTMQVIVQSTSTGNQCLTAQKVVDGVYRFMITMPETACRSYTIQYCTTNCVAGASGSSTTKFARRSDGAAFQSRLRAADFQAGCTSPIVDEDCTCDDIQLTCPLDITACADPVTCCAIVDFAPTLVGGCANATVVCVPPSGSCFPLGTTQVTCTATDEYDMEQCIFFVTVVDCTAPVITCPGDITTCNEPGLCSSVVTYQVTATDGCSNPVSVVCNPPSGASFPVGTTAVLCTATDSAGQTSQCSFNVTVDDCDAPTITCPSDVTTCNDAGECCAVVTFSLTGSDNCPGVTFSSDPPSGSCFPVGQTSVNCTATDASGNTATCSFTVTVNDCDAPSVVCSPDVTTCNDLGQCSAVVTFADPVASDNCPGATATCSPASGSTFPIGSTTVVCTATDAAGNSTQCSFAVIVNDCEAPSLLCSPDVTVCNDAGQCSAIVTFADPIVGDNCPGASASCSPPSGSTFPVGASTVVCTAIDAAGNSTQCSFTVTVNDCEPPAIQCPADIVTCTDAGLCSAVVNYNVLSSDNCPGSTLVCNPPSGSAFARGTTQVNCTVTDASGAQASCSFLVTVQDCEPPTIQCPPNVVETWSGGPPAQIDPNHTGWATFADNCTATLTYSDSFQPGTQPGEPETIVTRTWTVTDGWGNQASCVQTITLLSPSGGGGVHLDAKPGNCPNVVSIWSAGTTSFGLVGTFQVDPANVDPLSLKLQRADGVGRKIPLAYFSVQDVATPFYGPASGCHAAGADGTMDLEFVLQNWKLRRAFMLSAQPDGAEVQLALTGRFLDGTVFYARDFITVSVQ